MKTNRNYGIMVMAAALLMAGCTEDLLDGRRGEVPITLTTVVQGSDGGTRAATNLQSTQLGAGEEVYVTFSGGSSVVSLDHVAYTSDGNGAMTPATLPCFAFGGTSTTVNAYYGKSGGASGTQVTGATTSFSVAQDQSGDAAYKASDLMHATTTVEKSNPTGVLSLKHKMAKIIVNATLGEGISSITGVYIIGGNRTIALSSDGACTLGATSDALSANSPLTMYTGSGVSVSCAALLPPQTITGDFLKVMTNRGAITFSLDNKSFATGKSYVYNLESNATSIGHTTDITDWDTSEDAIELVNNGTAALTVPPPSPPAGVEIIDLGLSVKWANMNVGATSETDYGTYFAWGETSGYTDENNYAKTNFSWDTYAWCNGASSESMTKYSTNAQHWDDNINSDTPDNKTQLELGDDAAYMNWGEKWRMPTAAECFELVMDTDQEWTTINSVAGRKFMKKSDHSVYIFLPAAGYRINAGFGLQGSDGIYWSSTTDDGSDARLLGFGSGDAVLSRGDRYSGCTIRPVYSRSLTDVSTDDVGNVICSNGHIHNTVSAVNCGGTASAMIAYVGNLNNADGNGAYSDSFNHGLAIALTDVSNTSGAEGSSVMTWADAGTAASAYTRARSTTYTSAWFLPSAYQWERIMIGCGGTAEYTTDLNDGLSFSYGNFRTKLTSCGGTDVQSNSYWSSTANISAGIWDYQYPFGRFFWTDKTYGFYVRAVFAF